MVGAADLAILGCFPRAIFGLARVGEDVHEFPCIVRAHHRTLMSA